MARRVAKFLAALAGAAAQAVNLGLLDGDAQQWATVAVGVLTAAAVYLVPNAPTKPRAPAPGNPYV